MRMISENEQEHLDHVAGSASEFQNCFEEASIARVHTADREARDIAQALSNGLFVVVNEQLHYCRATDAVTGSVRYFDSSYLSIGDALQRQEELQNGDPDARVSVEPHLPVFYSPAPVDDGDDIPF